MNRKLEIENQKAFEAEKRTYEKSVAYQHALQSQLVDFENRKLDEYEQFLKEKAMVDAIVAKILEEDEKYEVLLVQLLVTLFISPESSKNVSKNNAKPSNSLKTTLPNERDGVNPNTNVSLLKTARLKNTHTFKTSVSRI
ncbi:hypothetical protein BCR33DRAFT_427080 [Rhizoclosmatium globosum]|uniref:Trichohyalin-plectin-homology domain-containing protein n=1 Tax=Rhizoclosmatium globosum TaxID=329046 RepID=A0A1Y2BV53_9FUNG|nr:hypothetical protein BCR33DRAFT_427080 [Rhizoclosmatium globosum]|eukprot:ORY38641.1 hypothetical protein BCR33DRAFT_427080 [Rhizoclosmatium globosum]